MPSISADVVTTVVYGTAATIIGVVTIYQSYKAWRLWREHHHNSGQSSQGVPDISAPLAPKDKLYLLLCTDVELASGSGLFVQQEPSNTASTDVAPVHDTDNIQPVANEVTEPTSSHQLAPSNTSTTDIEPTEIRDESQPAASQGLTPDAACAVPAQDSRSTQAVADTEDLSVSYPPLNPPDDVAISNTPVHSTDRS